MKYCPLHTRFGSILSKPLTEIIKIRPSYATNKILDRLSIECPESWIIETYPLDSILAFQAIKRDITEELPKVVALEAFDRHLEINEEVSDEKISISSKANAFGSPKLWIIDYAAGAWEVLPRYLVERSKLVHEWVWVFSPEN